MQNNKNVLLATILSVVILLGWTWLIEKPRIEKEEAQRKAYAEQHPKVAATEDFQKTDIKTPTGATPVAAKPAETILALKSRKEIF